MRKEHERRRDRLEDEWDDRDHYGGGYWIYWDGEETTYVVTVPCEDTVRVEGTTYYSCETGWYERTHVSGDVVYVRVPAPPGY